MVVDKKELGERYLKLSSIADLAYAEYARSDRSEPARVAMAKAIYASECAYRAYVRCSDGT